MPIPRLADWLLLVAFLCSAAHGQVPGDWELPPPQTPAGGWTSPGPPASTGIQLPHAGQLQEPPESSAAERNRQKPTVSLREFRSSVPEVFSRGATDMFIAALVRSGRFRVVERARMAEGAGAEKALNQQGMTTGPVGQRQYLGADYIFEATVSEASVGERSSSFTLGVAGATAGHGRASDSLAVDVRVVDVESGIVVDAVTVRRSIESVETRVQGITSALANFLAPGGAVAAAMPADQYLVARKESVDKALRSAIDEAVRQVSLHLEPR